MIKYISFLFLFFSCNHFQKGETKEQNVFLSQLDSIQQTIDEGDIIFRGGTDIESEAIREFSKADKLFSHCGIIIKKDSILKVVHILGGYTNTSGSILYQSVDNFLSYPNNESAGVYATNLLPQQVDKLNYFLDSVSKADIRFDLKFNLFTKDKLYCTELVIDALSYVKNDSTLFKPTIYNLANTKYFFLANKKTNFLFYPIDAFQHNNHLKEKKIFLFPNYSK